MPVGPYLERVSLETLCKARHRLIPGTGLADNGEGRGGPRDISASYLDAIGLARLVHVGTGSGSGHAPAVGGLLAHIAEGSLGLAAEGGAGEHAVDKTPRSGGQGEWLSRRKGGQWGGGRGDGCRGRKSAQRASSHRERHSPRPDCLRIRIQYPIKRTAD